MNTCKHHPKYKGVYPPRCGCRACWEVFYTKHTAIRRLYLKGDLVWYKAHLRMVWKASAYDSPFLYLWIKGECVKVRKTKTSFHCHRTHAVMWWIYL